MQNSSILSDRPLSIQELQALSVTPWHPARHSASSYLRAVESLYQQALVYRREDDLQTAWVCLAKAAKLAVDLIPTHPMYYANSSARRSANKKRANEIIELMGEIKPILQRNYDEWSRTEAELPSTSATANKNSASFPSALQVGVISPRARAHIPERLQPVVDKAIAYVPPSVVQRTQSGLHFFASRPAVPDDRDTQAIAAVLANDFSDWKPTPVNTGKRPSILDLAHQSEQGYTPSKVRPAIQYPSLTPAHDLPVYKPVLPQSRIDGLPAPSRPLFPIRPEKVAVSDPLAVSASDLPTTEDGIPLRHIFLPSELVDSFVALALSNTDRKIETCGLLLGTLKQNKFAITTLLIPQQIGSSDNCEMVGEELIFDYQDSRNLLTCGWIHTHPTQTCFLSSIDLHTHCGYQLSLREGIAIVCSPTKEPHVGIFRLTSPPGLDAISHCQERGFHSHPAIPLYTDADGDKGHVRTRKLPFDVVDLRK